VYYCTKRFYNKTLTFTSFYFKNYVILNWYTISASKIVIMVFVRETNTGYVGGFLQVQRHYWGVNISRELLNPGLWKLQTIHWSHHVPTTKSTPFVVSENEGDTKEGPGKSMRNALYVQQHGKRHLSGWSDVEQWKNQVRSLSHCWVTQWCRGMRGHCIFNYNHNNSKKLTNKHGVHQL